MSKLNYCIINIFICQVNRFFYINEKRFTTLCKNAIDFKRILRDAVLNWFPNQMINLGCTLLWWWLPSRLSLKCSTAMYCCHMECDYKSVIKPCVLTEKLWHIIVSTRTSIVTCESLWPALTLRYVVPVETDPRYGSLLATRGSARSSPRLHIT